MLKLIVNADDLGAGSETDRGIFQAFTDGLVTSASLLATGPTARPAAGRALELGLPLGVHLNLSEGCALTGAIPGLTDANGRFPGKQPLRDMLATGRLDTAAVAAELQAQTDLVRSCGIEPDHLDTHQHCFLWPPLTRMIIQLARDSGIPALRCPLAFEKPGPDLPAPLRQELADYRRLGLAAGEALRASGLRYPDGLLGMGLLDRLTRRQLLDLIDRLPAQGCLELMVHPGYPDPANPFGGPRREVELQALTDPVCRERLRQTGTMLISFGELPCAC